MIGWDGGLDGIRSLEQMLRLTQEKQLYNNLLLFALSNLAEGLREMFELTRHINRLPLQPLPFARGG